MIAWIKRDWQAVLTLVLVLSVGLYFAGLHFVVYHYKALRQSWDDECAIKGCE